MEKLVLHMNSRCYSTEELKKLVEKLSQKGKFKNEKATWVELLKVLVNKVSEGHSDVLLQNILKLIKSQNYQPQKDGAVSKKEARLVLESLSDLITRIHNGLKKSDASQSDLSRVMAAILPVVIDMKVQLIRKEKSAAAEVIYNKLSSLLGHSPELLIDALLHCKTLIYSKLREPEIFVHIIKREFSSLKASPSCLSPELFLKYLVLAKFLLFMTPREELSQTRAQVLRLLRLPSSFSEWISQNQIEWLRYDKLDTKTVLKNIIISTVLQTLYSKKGRALSPVKKKKEADGKLTVLSSQLKSTPVCRNGTGLQNGNEGTTYSLSESDRNISDIPSCEKSRKHKRKVCEDTSEIPSQTKKKKKKSKAKGTVHTDSSVTEALENGQWNQDIIPENTESQKDATEKQSSKEEGKDNADEMVINPNTFETHVTEIPKDKLTNMEQSVEVDSDVKTHSRKKKKKKKKKNKKKKKKTGSEMGNTLEASNSFSETEPLKVETIKESCDLTNIGETKSLKKSKRKSMDSSRVVDVSSIANAANKEAAIHKPSCIVTTNDTGKENEMQDAHFISESLLNNEESKVKKKKKKKQKHLGDPEECLVRQKKILESSSLKFSEVNIKGQTEKLGSLKTSEVAYKKKKKKPSEEFLESLPKKMKMESEHHTVKEKEEPLKTPLSVESTTVGAETKILKKKKTMKEKSSNVTDKGKRPKEVAKTKTKKVDKVSREIVLGESAKVGEDKMKAKQSRRDKTRINELSKEDNCIGKSVSGNAEESTRNTEENTTCEGKKTKKKKVLKDVCNVECKVKLDQTSELKKAALMNLVKKSKISKKQFLKQMLDVVLGGSEGDDTLKQSILVKLSDEVNGKKGTKKSKEVKDSNVEKLKESKKKKKKRRSELFVETTLEPSEFARKRKLSLSIEKVRDDSRKARRRRTCSLTFDISELEPEKYMRNAHKTVINAVSEPSSSNFESINVQSDAHSARDKVFVIDNLEDGRKSRVDLNLSGNGVGVGSSKHAEAPALTESRDKKTEGNPINKTLNKYSSENTGNLKNRENELVGSSESDKMLSNEDNNTGCNKYLEREETRIMDKFIPEDSPSEGPDESSGIEIVFVGNIEKPSFDQEENYSERDEASGSDGDIVPCDEINRMFTEAETKAYHKKVLEEGVKWKVHDALIDNKTSSNSKVYENSEESKEDSNTNINEDLKQSSEDVLHGFDDNLEDSDSNCCDRDIDVILETIVRDTGRESSVAGLKEELKRPRSSISNDDTVVGVSSLIVSNGEGRKAVGANDESVSLDENNIDAGKVQTVALNCKEPPAVVELCDLGDDKDEMTDIPVTDMREIKCLDALTPKPVSDINPKLNGKCQEVSTIAEDNKTSVKSLNVLGKVCEENSESSLHLQVADKRVKSSGHTVLLTEDRELNRSKIIEVTAEDNEHVMKYSSPISCCKSLLQNGDKNMSATINGSDGDMAQGKDSVSSKQPGQCIDMEVNLQTEPQQSSKSGSSLGDFVTAFEDLETSQTAESILLSVSPMKCHNEVIHSEKEATYSLDSLCSERVNGIESDANQNLKSLESRHGETNGTDEPLVRRLPVSDESPVSEGASVKKAKAVDESFEVTSNEGDEAYEASSDASEEPLPVSRKRTRSQRKLVQASRISEEVSDSDFSPVCRSLRGRRASEGRKKNACAKVNEKLMKNSNACVSAKSGPESDSDTSSMCNSTETTVTKQSNKEIDESSLQNLVSDLETKNKDKKEDLATDGVKKPYLSELDRIKFSGKHAVDCIVGEKSTLDGVMQSHSCMGSQSAPEFVPDGDNDSDDKSLLALESLASMHKLCEREKTHTGVVPDEVGMLLDNFSALEANECFKERFSCIEEIMQTINEEEGDEIEVLSSGLDEDEELSYNLSVGNSLAADGSWDMGKGLTNTVRSRRLRKRLLNNNTNGSIVGKNKEDFGNADIPQLKAQCVSEVVLKKEILISPEVSDEECELVSPEEDASRKRLQAPDNIIDTQARLSKGSISPFSMRGSRSGIRSPQKLIPEEQDESSPRQLRHSPVAKESPGQKAAKLTQRSSSSERGTVVRHSSSNSPKSVASRKTDTSKITPHKHGDALQFGNISPRKSAFSKSASKEEKSLKPQSNGNASETDHDGALKASNGTLDIGGQPSLLLSVSGNSSPKSSAKHAGNLTESEDSLFSKLGECNKLIGAEFPSVVRKMTEEDSVISDSCDKNPCSSETDNSVSDTKSTDDTISSFPSIMMPVRRSSRLSLSKLTLKGRTQSKAASPNKQIKLQEINDSELLESPRKCKWMGKQENEEKCLKEENQLSTSCGSPKELVDISSPTTPQKSHEKNQGSASPSSVEKPSAMVNASPSRGRPKKTWDSSPLTPRKTGMQGISLTSTPIITRRQGLVPSVCVIKKDGSSSNCSAKESESKRISSPSVSPQKSLLDSKAADMPEVDSGRSASHSASSSPCGMSHSKVTRNAVCKIARVQVGQDLVNSESDSGKSTVHSDDSHTLPNVLHTNRVSTRGKTSVVCPTISGKASVNLQQSIEDESNVSTRRLRHRDVTYTTKR